MQYLIALSQSIHPGLWIILSTLLAFVGDYYAKMFTTQSHRWYIGLPLSIYMIGTICFIISLFSAKFSIANIYRNLGNISFGLILGFFVFKDQLSTLQIIGMVLALIGVICMSIE